MNGASPKRRPAEWSGVAGSVALLVARVFGVTDADTIVALGAVIGFIPTAVTVLITTIRNGKNQP